jgi:hypothetical protein
MTDRLHIAPSQTEGHFFDGQVDGHLTEEQLDDHLIGDLAAAPAAHLAACPLCTARVADAGQPMAGVGSVSLAWAERVSATAPMPSMPAARTVWERRLSWSMAVATCAVAIGVTTANFRFTAFDRAAASSTVAQSADGFVSAPSTAQISSDNQLLKTIDFELADSSESPAALGLISTGSPARLPGGDSIRD